MLTIPGFSLTEQIYSSTNNYIYRGIKDNQPVILKVLKDEYPSIEAIVHLKHEYSVVCDLNHDNVVKALNLEAQDKRLLIVFEDFGGISLKEYLSKTKPSVDLAVEIAIAITQSLVYIHSQNIIHKDIKPANIIINPITGKVKLTDFGIACRLSKEIVTNNPNQIEGTLAYMSPEQTGRMNRVLDYRTDFYSLGVTLYELLTNKLPFNCQDVMELVHSHVALSPTPIKELNPQISNVLAGIIDKLMAKNAEDRYQSAKGLLADFSQLASGNTSFIPGEMDLRSQLLIPQKLYGREEQVTFLLGTFEQVVEGKSQLVLVSGYSGIGKTSVIHEVNKPITAMKGYFISGKFDQFKRDIPYASLIQALSSLMQQLLTESLAKIEIWKDKIKEAVGKNGQLIIDVIPSVELIIGKQPSISELPPTEAQNRFNQVFQEFIKVFSRKEHPLVIFLDDLQWADSATLKLMQILVTNVEIQHLLLIGAYRDNEVSPTHPLITTIESIEKAGTYVNNIVLQPLDYHSVEMLVAETLDDNKNRIKQFAELIFNKTTGNPFFITQLLQVLYQESLLIFDFYLRLWQWDIKEIQAIGITDQNVVELVANRIQKLSSSTQEILKIAACIGDKFTLDVLSLVSGKSTFEAAIDLDAALQTGFILPLNEAYRIPLLFKEQESVFDSHKIIYKFLHDRVQQAAYSLIPQEKKQKTHISIGTLLKESTKKEDLSDNILDIVNQLNYGVTLLTEQKDKYELAYLNRIAGQKAKKNSAFNATSKYLNISMSLLDESNWQANYNFMLDVYVESAEAEYLNSNFETAQKLANIAIEKASNTLDKSKAYEIIMQVYITQNMLEEALTFGIRILRNFNVNLTLKPTIINVFTAIAQTKLALVGKQVEDLINLPEMTDPYKLAIMRILMMIIPAASQAGSLLFPLSVLAIVKLSVKYGNSPAAAFGYTVYGAILCDKFVDIETGYKFGSLGLKLLEKMDTSFLRCKIYFLFHGAIKHFKDPIIKTINPLTEAMQYGLEIGDIEYIGYNAWVKSENLFFSGINLESVASQIAKYIKQSHQLNLSVNALCLCVFLQKVLNIQGESSHNITLAGKAFNEVEQRQNLVGKSSTILGGLYASKAVLAYLFHDYSEAINNALLTEKCHESNPGFLPYSVNNFYHSLALLAQYPKTGLFERKQYLKQVATNQKKMKLWAHHAPCNYQHKYDLVEAEKARILCKRTIASDLYDKAIAGAKANDYTQEVALANELAAKFYLELGKENIAKVYMTDAYYAYVKWGAFAKVRDLEEKYPTLIIRTTVQTDHEIDVNITISSTSTSTKAGSTSSNSQILDLATVIKASEAIQSDIILKNLPHNLLHIIIENAGAKKGVLMLEKDDKLRIEAIDDNTTNSSIREQSFDVEESSDIPIKVINYVERTKQPLVIRDAQADPLTNKDSYVQSTKTKSVLCLPIIYQGKLIGLIYLENNLTTGVFNPQRLELLKVLASQAAIALKNAQLLEKEQHKSQILQESLEQLEQTQGQLVEKASALENALIKLTETQGQLVHTEKISALGQLVAGVAHEVNNPVSFIGSNLSLANQYVEDLVNVLNLYREKFPEPGSEILEEVQAVDLEYLLEDLPKMLNSMKLGTLRIKDIMQSLRNFSRNDGTQKRTADIHEGIDSTILILGHRLKAGPTRPTIKVTKEYGDIGKVDCYPGALNQVFMNLLANAIDAMEEGNEGKTYQEIEKSPNAITIRTTAENCYVIIAIKDNGPGMSDTTLQKLFEAFYTTKPEGKGTGLGLSISYKIITEQHSGKLEVNSMQGSGAEFVIMIPLT
jgi:predicted ATPase/signal transduction histidine kinase